MSQSNYGFFGNSFARIYEECKLNHFDPQSFEAGLNSLDKIFEFAKERPESFESQDYALEAFITLNRTGLPDSVVKGNLSNEGDVPGFVKRAVIWVKEMFAKLVAWVKSIGQRQSDTDDKVKANLKAAREHLENLHVKGNVSHEAEMDWFGDVPPDLITGSKTTVSKVEEFYTKWMEAIKTSASNWGKEVQVTISAKTHEANLEHLKVLLDDLTHKAAKPSTQKASYTDNASVVFAMIDRLIRRSDDSAKKLGDVSEDAHVKLDHVTKEISDFNNRLAAGKLSEFEVKTLQDTVRNAAVVCGHVRTGVDKVAMARITVSGITLPLLGHK